MSPAHNFHLKSTIIADLRFLKPSWDRIDQMIGFVLYGFRPLSIASQSSSATFAYMTLLISTALELYIEPVFHCHRQATSYLFTVILPIVVEPGFCSSLSSQKEASLNLTAYVLEMNSIDFVPIVCQHKRFYESSK